MEPVVDDRKAEVGPVLVRAARCGDDALRVRRDKRRGLLHAVINDLLDGARSLGELDVGRELRSRGLPAPARQVLRVPLLGLRLNPDEFFGQIEEALVAAGWRAAA
jgi:hypothetical protein